MQSPNQPPWQNEDPQGTNPQGTDPQALEPQQSVEPQAVEPRAVEPQAVGPQPAEPQPGQPFGQGQYGQQPEYGQQQYGHQQPAPSHYGQSPLPPAYNDPLPPPTGYAQSGPVDNSVNGTVVLVMGILGLLFCQIFGIVAWVMGNNALKTLDSGRGDQSQRQLVVVGRVLGIIATVIMILLVVFFIFIIGVAAITAMNAPRPSSTVVVPSAPFQP
jgi:hypothetical protein